MACLLLKTSCDCIARITLFSVFMYVQNEGQFSTRMTLIAYYSVFVLLMIFNCWINKNKNFWSAKNLLGMFPMISNKAMCKPFNLNTMFTGIVLNSLSSILSYNSFNFDAALKKETSRKKGE